MFQILLYALWNSFDSTNLIKFIWPCVAIADWFNQLLIVDWFNYVTKDFYLILWDVKSY